eukprot:scpid80530/ scgid10346/ PI-PLC X domain-containing protein 2
MAAGEVPNFSSWMGEEEDACKALTPFQVVFPGTHDSGSSMLTGSPVIGLSSGLNALCRVPCFRRLIGRWTITQPGLSIHDQLVGGIRFLDFRIASASRNKRGEEELTFILIHTFMVGYLEDALRDIVRFIDSHPTELVLVSCIPYNNIDERAYQSYVEQFLSKHACPASKLSPTTTDAGTTGSHGDSAGGDRGTPSSATTVPSIYSLTSAGHNLILIGNPEASSTPGDSTVWLSKTKLVTGGPFRSLSSVEEKQDLNHQQLANYSSNTATEKQAAELYQLTHTVTPDAKSIVKDILTCKTLISHADAMNATLPDFVSSRLSSQHRDTIKIITVDNFITSDVVAIAKKMLRDRLQSI